MPPHPAIYLLSEWLPEPSSQVRSDREVSPQVRAKLFFVFDEALVYSCGFPAIVEFISNLIDLRMVDLVLFLIF